MSPHEDDDDLRDLYQELILDHGKHPRNFRAMERPDAQALGHNPLCGDKLVLALKISEDGTIADAAFQGEGCAISMASASMMTEMLRGKTAAGARALVAYFNARAMGTGVPPEEEALLDPDDLARLGALSGVRRYPVRVKCATLPWRTFEAALDPAAGKKARTE